MKRFSSWTHLLPLLILLLQSASAHGEPVSEYQVKGAYLYNFTKFVTWPPTAFARQQDPFRLCVLGQNPFGQLLEILTKKSVNNKRISVDYLGDIQQVAGCHLLFVARSEQEKLPEILAAIQEQPILTVGDMPDFVQQGGMIHFILVNDTLRFVINQETALEAGLKINAMLLQIGQVAK